MIIYNKKYNWKIINRKNIILRKNKNSEFLASNGKIIFLDYFKKPLISINLETF